MGDLVTLLPLVPLVTTSRTGDVDPFDLQRSIGLLPLDLRRPAARYLEACPIFFAWMEYTRDVLGDQFGVEGGSAVVSDGDYYWRLDGASYVATYGIGLPADFIARASSRDWTPPVFNREEYLAINDALEDLFQTDSSIDRFFPEG